MKKPYITEIIHPGEEPGKTLKVVVNFPVTGAILERYESFKGEGPVDFSDYPSTMIQNIWAPSDDATLWVEFASAPGKFFCYQDVTEDHFEAFIDRVQVLESVGKAINELKLEHLCFVYEEKDFLSKPG